MSDEIEFSIYNIWLGMLVFLLICNTILMILSIISYNVAIICCIIMCILYINVFVIVRKEIRIWARVI